MAAQKGNSALLYGKGDGTFGTPVPIKDEIGTRVGTATRSSLPSLPRSASGQAPSS